LEVDFILGAGEVAIEVKGSSRVEDRDLRPLAAFLEEQKPRRAFLVCNETAERRVGEIRIVPWRSFLRALWSGDIIQ
jgi:predicted AAA+ superfamily ATPase